jgi:uridine kinase
MRTGPPLVIGICGGSGSGKSYFTRKLLAALPPDSVDVLHHDCYYRDLSHLAPEQRWERNFDHPDSLQTDLLVRHLDALCVGVPVETPLYDFLNSVRHTETRRVEPRAVLLMEGILILADAELRRRLDLIVFIEAAADLRLARRLRRDPVERQLPPEYVLRQWHATVRPMHDAHVEPGKAHAHLILSGESDEHAAPGVEQVLRRIREHLGEYPGVSRGA